MAGRPRAVQPIFAILDMTILWTVIRRLAVDEAGQDLIEYALLAGLIGSVGVLAWQAIGVAIHADYASWDTAVQGISNPPDPAGSGS